MPTAPNPFNELYITENVSPDRFVAMFSPLIVSDTLQLFSSGNVVLTGTQGSGKSMLLSLLRPEIRLAYLGAGEPFPLETIDPSLARFIGCGINLTSSGSYTFGQRPIEVDGQESPNALPVYFGDFLNYWIVRDLLNTLDRLVNSQNAGLLRSLGINSDRRSFDAFAVRLARAECWFDYLRNVSDYVSLKVRIQERLREYRSFLNYNSDSLPVEIKETKTIAGEPISKSVLRLWAQGVVAEGTRFLIQVDQYEELVRLETCIPRAGYAS